MSTSTNHRFRDTTASENVLALSRPPRLSPAGRAGRGSYASAWCPCRSRPSRREAPAEEPVVLNLLEALKQSVAQASQAEKVAQTSAAAQSRKPRARRQSG
jgi:hypothetical protein